MPENKSIFNVLNSVDVSDKIKTKNNLSYISWASAWAEVKKKYPDAQYRVIPQKVDEFGNNKFWHDDGKSGWVEVGVTIGEQEIIEVLAIMDYKNKSIPSDQITSVDANKAVKRCLTKACALHGLALYIYEGEDIPEELSKTLELKSKIKAVVDKKVKLSEKAKEKVAELCKTAEKQDNPNLEDDLITGNYNNIENIDVLTDLHRKLLAVRK